MINQTTKILRDLDVINGREIYLYGCLFMCLAWTTDRTRITPELILTWFKASKTRGIIGEMARVKSFADLLALMGSPFVYASRRVLDGANDIRLQNNELGIVRWATGNNGTHFTVYANVKGIAVEVYDPFSKLDEDVRYDIKRTKADRIDILRII